MTRAVETLTIVETDGHILCCDCGAQGSAEARVASGPASTKDQWAQEPRKLELQGKQEQARAIRETFLAGARAWTPWTRRR